MPYPVLTEPGDRLAQALSNLMTNACQHGVRGTPILVEVDGTDGDFVVFALSNEGEVPPEVLPVLFDPFRSVNIFAAPEREYEHNPATETDSTTWPADFESWAITTEPRFCSQPQVLRTCKQIYLESLPFFYSLRTFNLSARESPKLLLHNIGPAHFKHIRRIILEWDALEEFSRALNRQDFYEGTSGLESITTSRYWSRHVSGTGTKWRHVKVQERMICQAAHDIVTKHARVRIVAESLFRRRASAIETEGTTQLQNGNIRKVKWRFIVSDDDLRDDEVAVDIRQDLAVLKATQDEADAGGFVLPMLDPL